jgi:DNA-binding protein HU-beta
VEDDLVAGRRVLIPGFGIFKPKRRPEREGRNPQTGKVLKIAPRRRIAFRAAWNVQERLDATDRTRHKALASGAH